MAVYRRPGSPYYWAKLYHHGRVVRFSTRETTKTRALSAERDKAEALDRDRKEAVQGRYSLATLAAKFLIWKEADKKSAETLRSYRNHISLHIVPHFGAEADIRRIDEAALENYKTARTAAGVTIGKELVTLRQMLKYAARVHRAIDRVPAVQSPTHRYEPKWRLLKKTELKKLIKELKKAKQRGREAYPYFLLMANTGMRGGELEKMTWEMVDLKKKSIALPGAITKTRRPREVPLNQKAMTALRIMRKSRTTGRVFLAKRFYATWRAACKRAGLGKVRPHDLRHTYGSMLHEKGERGPVIRDILGHVTLTMESHYAHTHDKQRHKAVAKVVVG